MVNPAHLSHDAEVIRDLEWAQLTFPGPLVAAPPSDRPIPGFTMGVPQGWLVRPCPGAIFAMGTADTFEGPWSNVIVRHETILADKALDDVARLTWPRLEAEFPDVELLGTTAVTFEQTHYIRTMKLTMPAWPEPVNRTDSFVFAPHRGGPTTEMFHFIWLNALEATGPYAELYAAMLRSLHFSDAAPRPTELPE